MLASRAVVVFLVAVAFAACVRNPVPASPAAAPPGASASVAPEDASGEIALPRWEWHHAASRRVVGIERAGAPLPREWRGLRVAERARCAAFEPADYVADGLLGPRLRA